MAEQRAGNPGQKNYLITVAAQTERGHQKLCGKRRFSIRGHQKLLPNKKKLQSEDIKNPAERDVSRSGNSING